VVFCVLSGARIVRVHDVRAVRRAVTMTETVLGWRRPAVLRHNV
jgi:dihydropteroate synthase